MRSKRVWARVGTLVALSLLVGCQLPPLGLEALEAPASNNRGDQATVGPVDNRPMSEQIKVQYIVAFKGERLPRTCL